jgi:hypothetical protein
MPVKESMNAEGFRKHRDIYTKKYLQILRKYHESLKKKLQDIPKAFLGCSCYCVLKRKAEEEEISH